MAEEKNNPIFSNFFDSNIVRSECVDAFKPNGEKKSGCTRIFYNIKNEEVTREYCVVDPRKPQATSIDISKVDISTLTDEQILELKQRIEQINQ